MQRSHSKRGTQCMFSPIGLPLFSNRLSIWFTQDQRGLSKACNGDECKGSAITSSTEKDHVDILPRIAHIDTLKRSVMDQRIVLVIPFS
ncbi:hypothetical protein H5410_061229 [Solanum commersonii]|uniref:Uncharacterized protein n=1 Tax=Solanum commersonii TaxID=4109 RepID=A0A9J5W803_SOLCO|nr:hypothetical protein H5410_061229 [Solanum commersonii]